MNAALPSGIPQRLDRGWICAHIPHQGSMCLLEEVLRWDEHGLRCRSATHLAPDHPLRAHGRLGSACLIEYAAQATAIHGALLQQRDSDPSAGLLASARGVELLVERIDDIPGDLWIEAQRLHGDAGGALYSFRVLAAASARSLAQGRLSVRLQDRNAAAYKETP